MNRTRMTALLALMAAALVYVPAAHAETVVSSPMPPPIDITPLPESMPADPPIPPEMLGEAPVAPVEPAPVPVTKAEVEAPLPEDPVQACRDANPDDGYIRQCLAKKHQAVFTELKAAEDAALRSARAGGKDWHEESRKAQAISNSAMTFETFLVSECQRYNDGDEDAANAVTGCEIQLAQMRTAMLKQP